jgi:small conductance mechanosensitive channel
MNRLDALLNYGTPLILVISGLPGIGSTSLSTWLAGGAVLGALAFVFQGLLRDFFAGLVVLLEDGGVLVTSLRCLDQRVVVIPNSRCDRLVNWPSVKSPLMCV